MTDQREALLKLKADTDFVAEVTIIGLVQANYRGSVTKSGLPTLEVVPQRAFEGTNPEANPVPGLAALYHEGVLGWIFALASTTDQPEDYTVEIQYKQNGETVADADLRVSGDTGSDPLITDLRSFLRLEN